ncbi:MAG: hypothetical protein KJZ64_09480 [Sphingomonadaceae bacterium]|nr:hypothetical protein [Sphingomonadaceae bacterium]
MLRKIAALASISLLAGCASGPPRTPVKMIERALASAGTTGLAQPGQIVAAESGFARAAREQGQWSAFAERAAPGAVLHLESGPVDAAQWLRGRANPAEAMRWAPRDVWMSCDGTLAVSQGRFRDAAGLVGSYATAWKRQDDGGYDWSYHVQAPDSPQPPPRPEQARGQDEIVVLAMELIKGHVADCKGRPGAPGPQTNPAPVASATSPDGTLHWLAQQREDGARRVIVLSNTAGEWDEVLDIGFNPG